MAPPGVIRAEVGGVFATFDTRFGAPADGADTGRQPLSVPFPALLTAAEFVPIQTLQTALNAAYAAMEDGTPGFTASPETLFLSASAVRATADHRQAPFTLEVGLLPRISVRARVPAAHQRLGVVGLSIGDGSVGTNPDPLFNRTLLGSVDSTLAALGGAPFLPTAGSIAGRELQERVRAASGGSELRLPADPLAAVGVAGLATEAPLRTGRYDPEQPLWGVGDAELSVRLQLTDFAGDAEPGAPRRSTFRSAVELGVRLPTGLAPTADYLVLPPPDQGLAGAMAALHGEAYPAARIAARGTIRWESLRPTTIGRRGWESLDAYPPSPLTEEVRWTPGSILTLDVAPGFLLADEITLFGRYGYSRRSGERFEPVETGDLEAVTGGDRTAQRWGVGALYSTPPAALAARAGVPFEAEIAVGSTFAGSGGAPAARFVEMSARLYLRGWGGR